MSSALVPTLVAESDVSLDACSANDVADLLLVLLLKRRAVAVLIEPPGFAGGRHDIRIERTAALRTLVTMRASLADAVVARLAILAELELGARGTQAGRIRVKLGDTVGELFLSIRETPRGLAGELRRMVGSFDDLPVVSPAEAIEPADDVAVIGNYRLLGELGSGGMATVYRAVHVVLEKLVAIKVLHRELATDPTLAQQFVVEARAACRARHPCIVDVTDFGRFLDGRTFIVMELVEGTTLAKVIREGPLRLDRALSFAEQIASALAAAGSHGVVHRDLKPANIFVGAHDRVKIGDFGLALFTGENAVDDDRFRHRIVGTVPYMAPEQIRGEAADQRSDIYSLGCVLYEMLTGQPPFAGATLLEILRKQTAGELLTVLTSVGRMPEAIERIVRRALAVAREDRYQTAEDMRIDLDRAARSLARFGWQRWAQ